MVTNTVTGEQVVSILEICTELCGTLDSMAIGSLTVKNEATSNSSPVNLAII